jgi:hypothetical protein
LVARLVADLLELAKAGHGKEKGRKEEELLLLLDALRLCLREPVALQPAEQTPVLAALMRFIAPLTVDPPPTSGSAESNEEVALVASKCLLNLLHLSSTATALFLHDLEGLEWLGLRLWRGGRPSVLLYAVRTLYMLCSSR